MAISRKKFQEALKVLKGICKHPNAPLQLKFRAAELIAAIYGVDVPGSTKRDKRAVKDLVSERADEKKIQADVRAAVLERTATEAERERAMQEAKAFLAQLHAKQRTQAQQQEQQTEEIEHA